MVVGRSDFSLRAASEVLPLRDAFAVLFFVSVGMLFDPKELLAQPLLVIATMAIIVLVKPLVACLIVRLLGYPQRTALAVGIALGQIGEFSFILAEVARELGIFTDQAVNALVIAAIFSISLNPLAYRLVGPLSTAWAAMFGRHLRGRVRRRTSPSARPSHRPSGGPSRPPVTRFRRIHGVTRSLSATDRSGGRWRGCSAKMTSNQPSWS